MASPIADYTRKTFIQISPPPHSPFYSPTPNTALRRNLCENRFVNVHAFSQIFRQLFPSTLTPLPPRPHSDPISSSTRNETSTFFRPLSRLRSPLYVSPPYPSHDCSKFTYTRYTRAHINTHTHTHTLAIPPIQIGGPEKYSAPLVDPNLKSVEPKTRRICWARGRPAKKSGLIWADD